MLQFVLVNILLLSLGAVFYLVARSLARINEDGDGEETKKTNWIERWFTSELPERADEAVNSFMVKFLRKFKVFLLKIDNVLTKRLSRIKPGSDKKEGVFMGEEGEK